MMRHEGPNHQRRELVDLSFTRVIACRVGTSFSQAAKTGDRGRVRRDRPPPSDDSSFIRGFPLKNPREFTRKELKKATNNFSRKLVIGRGGFGEVFRGTLADGTLVAIKVLSKDSRQEDLTIIMAELTVGRATSSGSQPGLVRVVGYHFSLKRRNTRAMIVYAFMANGDMGCFTDDRQLERTPLDWPTRKRIILGAARGLCRLHELGIVHRDVKPSNIMLDEGFEAHLGDFGLARSTILPQRGHDVAGFCRDEDSDHCDFTSLCGTIGYLPPEVYLQHARYSRKSDVYGFGVSLIQLVMGRPAIDRSEEGVFIGCRAERLFKNGEDLTRHMHPGMWGKYDKDEAIVLIQLGLICTETDPKKRPLMPEVIAIMEGSVATMHQRWEDYEYHWTDELSFTTDNQFTGSGDVDEMPNASDSDTDEEELRENDDDTILPLANHELLSTTSDNQFTGNGDGDEIPNAFDSDTDQEELRENDDGTILPLGNQLVQQNAEVETELSEMRDRMRVMEAEMEGIRQKQVLLMESMAMMREWHTQQVNEMQAEIDRLRGSPDPELPVMPGINSILC